MSQRRKGLSFLTPVGVLRRKVDEGIRKGVVEFEAAALHAT
jgi:hypothetical protein